MTSCPRDGTPLFAAEKDDDGPRSNGEHGVASLSELSDAMELWESDGSDATLEEAPPPAADVGDDDPTEIMKVGNRQRFADHARAVAGQTAPMAQAEAESLARGGQPPELPTQPRHMVPNELNESRSGQGPAGASAPTQDTAEDIWSTEDPGAVQSERASRPEPGAYAGSPQQGYSQPSPQQNYAQQQDYSPPQQQYSPPQQQYSPPQQQYAPPPQQGPVAPTAAPDTGVGPQAGVTTGTMPSPSADDEKKSGGFGAALVVIVVLLAAVGSAAYYFYVRPMLAEKEPSDVASAAPTKPEKTIELPPEPIDEIEEPPAEEPLPTEVEEEHAAGMADTLSERATAIAELAANAEEEADPEPPPRRKRRVKRRRSKPKPRAKPKPKPKPKPAPKEEADEDEDLDIWGGGGGDDKADEKPEPEPEPKAEKKPEPKPEPKAEKKPEPEPEEDEDLDIW